MSFVADLAAVLAVRDFRRLYATRLTSQFCDGVFQFGLAGFVFFSPERQTSPAAAAAAFAVLLLPYSLAGPFAGVYIDRWSRRQILVGAASLRAVLTALTALFIATGAGGPWFYLTALGVISVNRFFLAALSAALPHVVARELLVMGNSVGPTSGTVAAFAGGAAGFVLRLLFGGTSGGTAMVVLCAAAGFAAAGLVAATMRRDLLGPGAPDAPPAGAPEPAGAGTLTGPAEPSGALTHTPEPAGPASRTGAGEPAAPGSRARRAAGPALRGVATGLADGARHVARCPTAAWALAIMGTHRFLYGVSTVMTVLLYRNYFPVDATAGLSGFTLVIVASGAGYFLAALLTPVFAERAGPRGWIVILLGAAAVLEAVLCAPFRPLPFVAAAFTLGLVSQSAKICVDTLLQETMSDTYRGRVFSLYDMMFNVAYVAAAAFAALTLPVSGKSYAVLALVAIGYATAGGVSWVLLRRGRLDAPAAGRPPVGTR